MRLQALALDEIGCPLYGCSGVVAAGNTYKGAWWDNEYHGTGTLVDATNGDFYEGKVSPASVDIATPPPCPCW